MKKVSLHTLGCKLNQTETAMLAEGFQQRGFEIVPFGEKADIIFINTCTVTGKTDYSSRQFVRKSLRKYPGAFIVVGGCYSELAAKESSNIKGIGLILGSESKFDIFKYVHESHKRSKPEIILSELSETQNI